jgi:hypothetical protein
MRGAGLVVDGLPVEMIYYVHTYTTHITAVYFKKESSCIATKWHGEIRKWALMTIACSTFYRPVVSAIYVTTHIGAILLSCEIQITRRSIVVDRASHFGSATFFFKRSSVHVHVSLLSKSQPR